LCICRLTAVLSQSQGSTAPQRLAKKIETQRLWKSQARRLAGAIAEEEAPDALDRIALNFGKSEFRLDERCLVNICQCVF
jgi:hypothetical protein